MIQAGNLNSFWAGLGAVLAPMNYTVSWVEILNLLRPIGVRHLPTGLSSPRHAPDSHGAIQIGLGLALLAWFSCAGVQRVREEPGPGYTSGKVRASAAAADKPVILVTDGAS